MTFFEHGGPKGIGIGWIGDVIRTVFDECFDDGIPVIFMENDGLLAGTNDSVVELTAQNNLFGRIVKVDAPVQNNLDIAWPDTVGRFAAAVGRFDHGPAAGRHYHINGLHQGYG